MLCNMGKIDRVLRVIVGVGLIAWAVMSGNLFGYAGIVLILTAGIGLCPLYALLGIDTGCKNKHP